MSIIALWIAVVAAMPAVADEIDADDLRPGLVARFRDERTEVVRVDAVPAFDLGPGESIHPHITPAARLSWSGVINVLREGDYRFAADLAGGVRVTIADRPVLVGRRDTLGRLDGQPVALESGLWPIQFEFERTIPAARFHLIWSAPFFRAEPLPGSVLYHLKKAESAELTASRQHDRGRYLAEEMGCANCHQTDRLPATRVGPNLSGIATRTNAGWLDRWLQSPHALRSATYMPAMFDDDDRGRIERYAVLQYLMTLADKPKPEPKPLKDRELRSAVGRGMNLFVTTGCVACHPIEPNGTAYSGSARVYPLGDVGSKSTPHNLADYLLDPLKVNPSGRMPGMALSANEARDLAHYLCRSRDATIDEFGPLEPADGLNWLRLHKGFDLDPAGGGAAWAKAGERIFRTKGCANCHAVVADGRVHPMSTGPKLEQLSRNPAGGCLSDEPVNVRFLLAAADRDALRAFVKAGPPASMPSVHFESRAALTRFACLNCHARDGDTGLSADLLALIRDHETGAGVEDVGPPTLTGVGQKLLTPTLEDVLLRGKRARPWMGMRMPQYGPKNVGFLAEGLARLDGLAAERTPTKPEVTAVLADAGRRLTGKSGFGCISCHDYAGTPNSGTRGPDLTLSPNRLRYDWYRRWLEQPQQMQPGTKMPQVFPDGKSTLTHIFEGQADEQAKAMWAYWSLGSSAPRPDGLEPPKGMMLAVADQPVVLRTFLPELGPRSIAVGLPGGASVAFDAGPCRLAYAWTGGFLDATPAWGNRGGAPAKPLGQKFWTAPPGHPWHLTDGRSPTTDLKRITDPAFGAPPAAGQVHEGPWTVRFLGYERDADAAPTFRYEQASEGGALSVRERLSGLTHPLSIGFERTMIVEVPPGRVAWLEVGDGGTVVGEAWVPTSAGRPLVLLPSPPAGVAWHVTADGRRAYIKVPRRFDGSPVRFRLRYWTHGGDEKLLSELSR